MKFFIPLLLLFLHGCAGISDERSHIIHGNILWNLDNHCFSEDAKKSPTGECHRRVNSFGGKGKGLESNAKYWPWWSQKHFQDFRKMIDERYQYLHVVHYMSASMNHMPREVSEWLLRDGKTLITLIRGPMYTDFVKFVRNDNLSRPNAMARSRKELIVKYKLKDNREIPDKKIIYGKGPMKYTEKEMQLIKDNIRKMNNRRVNGPDLLAARQKEEDAYWGRYYAKRNAWKRENNAQFQQMVNSYRSQSALSNAQGTINVFSSSSGGYDAIPLTSTESFLKSSGTQATTPSYTVAKNNTSKETHWVEYQKKCHDRGWNYDIKTQKCNKPASLNDSNQVAKVDSSSKLKTETKAEKEKGPRERCYDRFSTDTKNTKHKVGQKLFSSVGHTFFDSYREVFCIFRDNKGEEVRAKVDRLFLPVFYTERLSITGCKKSETRSVFEEEKEFLALSSNKHCYTFKGNLHQTLQNQRFYKDALIRQGNVKVIENY